MNIVNLRNNPKLYYDSIADGIRMRSKVKWYQDRQKSSNHFLT